MSTRVHKTLPKGLTQEEARVVEPTRLLPALALDLMERAVFPRMGAVWGCATSLMPPLLPQLRLSPTPTCNRRALLFTNPGHISTGAHVKGLEAGAPTLAPEHQACSPQRCHSHATHTHTRACAGAHAHTTHTHTCSPTFVSSMLRAMSSRARAP